MRKFYFLLALILAILPIGETLAQERMLAFPGADGYGKYTTGGRGGEVCYVTRTDDCSDNNLVEGTLRWALRHDNGGKPRTILFATSGTIYLTSKLKMQYPDVSILGQTAPGGGITITGFPLYICKNNVIIRYVRFRAGDIPSESLTGLDMENCDNVILDHCSMTWSMEECLTAYDTDYTTIQWCIVGEGLYNSKNSKGARAYAMQWGGEHSTMHHTLITNSMSRSPRFNGVRSVSNNPGDHDRYVDSEFANNVLFNWGTNNNGSYGGENYPDCKGYNRVYMINNYWRPGPNAGSNRYFTTPSGPNYGEYYLTGNKFELSSKYAPKSTPWSDAELAKVNADNYYGAVAGNASRGINITGANAEKYLLKELPYELSGLNYETADDAFMSVTTKAGASLPRYDEVDSRLLAEAAGTADPQFKGSNNKLGVIDSPDDVKLSYPGTYVVNGVSYNNMPRMFVEGQDKYMRDSDGDGMPDGYEDEVGLDKNNAEDGNAVAANGYTNLENYMNGVADGTIDKTKYETSATYVEPGPEVVAPETVTIIYKVNDTGVEGTVPAQSTGSYGTDGRPVKIPVNTTLYKEGYTLTGWTAEGKVYTPGQETVFKKETVTLTAIFTKNKVNMADRTNDVTVTWNVRADRIDITGSGIYVAQTKFAGADHDVMLRYDNSVVTIPTCAGATVKIDALPAANAKEEVTTGDTYVYTHSSGVLRSITVVMPYNWNTPDRAYYTPEIPVGADNQIFYTTPDNVRATNWILASYLDYPNDRTFIDPVTEDNTKYYVGKAVVVNNSDRTMDMFITGTEKVRVFVTSQSSNTDYALVKATPTDGEAVSVQSGAFEHKQDPKVLELALDKTKKYRLQVMSVEGNDVAVGAVKFIGSAPEITEGDASITWEWMSGEATENGVKIPSTMFTKAVAVVSSALGVASETRFGESFVKFTPLSGIQNENRTESDNIAFEIQPATGVFFLPQAISFHSVRLGTGSILFDVTVQQGNGEEVTVLEKFKPNRENESSYSNVSIDLTAFPAVISSGELLKVRIYVYDVFAGKYVGFNNIKISGMFSGTAPDVKKYTFNAVASPADAARISWTPAGSEFEDGTEVELIVKPASGYLFENWTDANGDVVSTKENFKYTVKSNTELTANYKSYDDYGYIFDAAPFDAAVKNVNELKVALAKANSREDMTQRYRIFLHNGVYDYGTSAKNEVKGNTSLIGESMEGVLITNCPSTTVTNYQDQTPTLFIDQNQNDVYMQDLTVRQARDWEIKKSRGQALAIRQRGKRAVYKNVMLQGIQDTYYLNKADGSAYFETSTIAGQTDYVYGDGTAWFEQCTMYNTGAGYITALNTQPGYYGMVFNNCTVEGDAAAAGKFYLGRPWNDSPHATYLNTMFKQLPKEEGWGKMTANLVLRLHEYGSMDANGNKLDLSKRSLSNCSPANGSDEPVITAEKAAEYTLEKVLGADWSPQARTAQFAAPAASLSGTTLSWQPVAGAIGYAIVKDGSVVAFTTDASYDTANTGAGQYSIRVANECGGLGAPSQTVTGINDIEVEKADTPIYNIQGIRVDKSYKGVVIQNGKKRIVK